MRRKLSARPSVCGARSPSKASIKLTGAEPAIEVDPETYVVKADGVELTCDPATELPMAQRFFLF